MSSEFNLKANETCPHCGDVKTDGEGLAYVYNYGADELDGDGNSPEKILGTICEDCVFEYECAGCDSCGLVKRIAYIGERYCLNCENRREL